MLSPCYNPNPGRQLVCILSPALGHALWCAVALGELTANVISLLSRRCMASVSMDTVAVLRLIPVSVASVYVYGVP
jgi:hypothetical protein